MIRIEESGMIFGPFDDQACYRIEHSNSHKSLGNGFKMVEFTYFDEPSDKLWLVEAKSSIPNPKTDAAKYETYFDQVFEKFESALLLHGTSALERNQACFEELPLKMKAMPWSVLKLQLRLVIPDTPNEFLPQLTDKLKQRLQKLLAVWRQDLMDIKVINADFARREGLIQ